MHKTEQRTLDIFTREALLRPDEKNVIIGCSGGPDSVALLHVMCSLREIMDVNLVTVYIDHGLRPLESEAEKEYVARLSRELQSRFKNIKVDARAHARRNGLSLEQGARELRYQALRSVAAGKGAAPIAVAHTADDQAEELLIRLLRGGGRKALSGMRFRNGDIIRPFLSFGKRELLLYLRENKIDYCIDSSNSDMRYLRNRVRHRLLPYLERYFDKGVRNALCKTSNTLAEDEVLLDELTEQALDTVLINHQPDATGPFGRFVIDRAALTEKPAALQRRVIEKLLWRIGGKAAFSHILTIQQAASSGRTGSEYHFSHGLRMGVQKKYIELLFPQGKCSWRGRLYAARNG